MQDSPPIEIVEGVSWRGLLTVLVAESGAGKTFALLNVAAAVSTGVAWHGRTTQQSTVAYCSFEGDALGLRLRAIDQHQPKTTEHVAVLRLFEPLSPLVTREGEVSSHGEAILAGELAVLQKTIAREGRPPLGLIVIDTVRASLTGSEDLSDNVAAYLRVARRLLTTAPMAGCILAHHAGWQDGEAKKQRERGSSAWRGNCDATLYLEAGDYDRERGEARLTLRTLKVRDGELPGPLHLLRRRVMLPEWDRHGHQLSSCIVLPDGRTAADVEAAQAAALADAHLETDLRLLRVIRDCRVTSLDGLRTHLGLRRDEVRASLGRVLTAGWAAEPARQRHPYSLTDIGAAILNGGRSS